MKRATNSAIVLFLISPAFSLPIIIHNIYKGNLKVLTLLALFMSLCAVITPPFADLYRHTQMYYAYKSDVLNDSFIQSNGSDYVLYTLTHFFAKIGIHFELIRGLFVFICYQISFILYKSLVKTKDGLSDNPKLCFYIFLCFFLSVPFIWIVSGLRSATSSYLMIYAWYLLSHKKIFWCIVCALLSVWTHYFSLIFLPFLFLYALSRQHINHILFVCLFVFSLLSGGTLLSDAIINFSQETSNNIGPSQNAIDFYIGGGLTYNDLSMNGLIALILERLPMIILILVNVFQSKFWCNKKEQTFVYLLILLTGLCTFFFIPFQRITWLTYPIMLYLILKNYNIRALQKHIYILVLATILLQFAYLYGYRDIMLNTPWYLLFFPAVIAFNHTYPSNYSI